MFDVCSWISSQLSLQTSIRFLNESDSSPNKEESELIDIRKKYEEAVKEAEAEKKEIEERIVNANNMTDEEIEKELVNLKIEGCLSGLK